MKALFRLWTETGTPTRKLGLRHLIIAGIVVTILAWIALKILAWITHLHYDIVALAFETGSAALISLWIKPLLSAVLVSVRARRFELGQLRYCSAPLLATYVVAAILWIARTVPPPLPHWVIARGLMTHAHQPTNLGILVLFGVAIVLVMVLRFYQEHQITSNPSIGRPYIRRPLPKKIRIDSLPVQQRIARSQLAHIHEVDEARAQALEPIVVDGGGISVMAEPLTREEMDEIDQMVFEDIDSPIRKGPRPLREIEPIPNRTEALPNIDFSKIDRLTPPDA